MIETTLYMSCGLLAGLLGGYLGLGGGIVMVPFMTIVLGVDIKTAVPVSAAAIVVNSFSASNEYLKKGMVDLQLATILSVFMVMGSITGSSLSEIIPANYVRLLLTGLLVYTAFSLLKGRKGTDNHSFKQEHNQHSVLVAGLALLTGCLAGLAGIGGGVILVPMIYLIIGLPLTTARGTASLITGFSSAAATVVYYSTDSIDHSILAPVVLGIIFGGKIGGRLGTVAKPVVIKVMFFVVMLYLAFKLGYDPVSDLL